MSKPHFTPSRRETLLWVAAATALGAPLAGCSPASRWPSIQAPPVDAPGYGMDPTLTSPSTLWPLTLSEAQRATVRIAADLILPADEVSPAAGALGVDAFVDEWVSAPYERQRQDRDLVLPGLAWLDAESQRRFDLDFGAASDAQRREIFDDIAHSGEAAPAFAQPAEFFARLRALIMAAYYTLPEGWADIGYIGNTPIAGDYPGPSEEALTHLREKLAELGLEMPT